MLVPQYEFFSFCRFLLTPSPGGKCGKFLWWALGVTAEDESIVLSTAFASALDLNVIWRQNLIDVLLIRITGDRDFDENEI